MQFIGAIYSRDYCAVGSAKTGHLAVG